MNPTEAARRLEALERGELQRLDAADSEQLSRQFQRMIEANVRSGNIWSAYEPQILRDELEKRISELRTLSADCEDEVRAGVFDTIADWMTEALACAEDDIRIERPVLNCATRLHPIDNISHMEMLSLWFGLEAGADWEVAEMIDNA